VSDLLQLTLSGLALGAIYALVAIGFVVIYRASQVFNFAHGELLLFGATVMVWLTAPPAVATDALALGGPMVSGLGWPWGLGLVTTMVLTGALAAAMERVALRPLVGRPVFVTIILTLFLGFLLRTIVMLIFGTDPMPLLTPWDPFGVFRLGDAVVDYASVASVIAGVIALSGYFLLIRKTRLGVAMRAASSDQETAMAVGVPVGRVLSVTWFIAGAFAALAGVFLGVRDDSVDMNLGFIALRAFPAVIVGGLESALGAAVAGLALGLLEVLTAGYINARLGPMGVNFHTVLPYLVMIAFLVFRPYGLFGQRTVERL
jgi:branched-chain amino acid transport system permease protein